MNELEKETLPSGLEVTHGSGNIFRDLDFSEEESASLLLRSQLMQRLQQECTRLIDEEGMTQEEVAKRLEVHQPRISLLMQGRFNEFSIDALVQMLSRAGLSVTVGFEPVSRLAA